MSSMREALARLEGITADRTRQKTILGRVRSAIGL
jgi:hypothetical protein